MYAMDWRDPIPSASDSSFSVMRKMSNGNEACWKEVVPEVHGNEARFVLCSDRTHVRII
jgi:hypothetical protein